MPFKDPEKRKQYQQEYRNFNREEIREREKARRQTDESKEKTKQYRLLNKEKIAERQNAKFECGCGGCYTRKNKLAHERGKAHTYWSKTGINVNTLEIGSNWHQHLKQLLKEDNK